MKLRVWFDPKISNGELLADRQIIGLWVLRPFGSTGKMRRCHETFETPDGGVFKVYAGSVSKGTGRIHSIQLASAEGAPFLQVAESGQLSAAIATGKGGYLHFEFLPVDETISSESKA